jgi:hypothetical protein
MAIVAVSRFWQSSVLWVVDPTSEIRVRNAIAILGGQPRIVTVSLAAGIAIVLVGVGLGHRSLRPVLCTPGGSRSMMTAPA